VAGEEAFEAADGFAEGFAFADSPVDVGVCGLVAFAAVDDDGVEGSVELAVAAAVEAVADGLAGAGGYRWGAGEAGEGGLGVEASVV
jgi:hypothetical protein